MKRDYIFPAILIVLQIAAAVVYLSQKDIRRASYWFFASCITVSISL